MATHSSILAWRIPRTEEPGGLHSVGSQRVRNYSSNLACSLPQLLLKPISIASGSGAQEGPAVQVGTEI